MRHLGTSAYSITCLTIAILCFSSCKKEDALLGAIESIGASKSFSNCSAPLGQTFSVATFGAIPNDGIDDTQAFILASQAVNAACNSSTRTVLNIPSGTYDVGKQLTPGQTWTVGTQTFSNPSGSGSCYKGIDIITVECCPNVTIQGIGTARLRFHNNMKFGGCGGCTQVADYGRMVVLNGTKCATVANLDLDGNNSNCTLLQACVDGYQLAYDGITAHSSTYLEISKVKTHHHGRDGIMLFKRQINGCPYSTNMQYIHMHNVYSEHNSRQGLSWCDGTDLSVDNSSFSYTGSVFYNNPGAGIDIEPDNGGYSARGVFTKCKIEHNRAFGVVSDNHPTDVYDVKFLECSIWNKTTGHAIWVTKGNKFNFNKSNIYGAIVHAAGVSMSNNVLFTGCNISDRGPDGLPCTLFQNTLLHQGPGDNYFEFNGCNFDMHYNALAFVEGMNTAPPYTSRRFKNNLFRFNYATLSCATNSNVKTIFCGGSNACNNSRYLAIFRNSDWSGNILRDLNTLTAAETTNKNYLITIGQYAPNTMRNSMDGTNTFEYVAGATVGHFLRQYDPIGGCWGLRTDF